MMSVQPVRSFAVAFAAGLAAAGPFAGCVGDEFVKGAPADGSAESAAGGSGGSVGSGGNGGAGQASGGSAPATGGAVNGGAGGSAPTDAGGDASEGGLPPPACVRDEDCAPFICRGTPSCREGVCTPGDPCESPEGGACVNECVRTETGASCVAMGRDQDRDGHRSALCADNPGDDCDDTEPAVHGTATEICDGLDNDCNHRADVFDGLPLGGENNNFLVVTNTAQLALVMRTNGYALLTNEMVDFYAGAGSPSDVRLLSFTGEVQRIVHVSPSPNIADPSIAASGDDVVLFGYQRLGTENRLAVTRRLGGDGVFKDNSIAFDTLLTPAQIWGRAVAGLPNGDVILAWAEHPATSGTGQYGGVAVARLAPADTAGAGSAWAARILPSTSRAYRPHIAVTAPDRYAVAWAEQQTLAGNDVNIVVHLTLRKRDPSGSETTELDAATDSFQVPRKFAQYQGEGIRPQVAFDGTTYTVAARGRDNSFRVTRVSAAGKVLCGPTPVAGVSAWGAAGSIVSTRQGVILVGTGTNGDVVIRRVSQGSGTEEPIACEIQAGPDLNTPARRVASSTVFETGEMPPSLGDPVILVGKDAALLTAWVERDKTRTEADASGVDVQNPPEPHRVVLRLLGPNLCD